MSENKAASAGAKKSGISRRDLVRNASIAGVGGLIVGGAGGYFLAPRGGSSGGGGGSTGGKVKIGLVAPVTGPYSGDGQEMQRGAEMAIEDLNKFGGVLGNEVELVVADISDQAPENFIQAAQRLVSRDKVQMITSGYATGTSVEFDTYAQSGIPTFHTNTLQANTDYVVKNGITNIFQFSPTEIWYASGFLKLMKEWIDSGLWTPSAKKVAVISSNDSYSISIAKVFQEGVKELGWTVSMYEEINVPYADWGPQLSKIRNDPPGMIFITDYLAGDLASFMKQFASAPTPSLVYQQYGPSVPEYLDLAGAAANGVVWSTTIGTLPDELGDAFRERYQKTYNAVAGLSQSGAQYDIVRFWAQAASLAGDVNDFERVCEAAKNLRFRGVAGTYSVDPKELTAIPYPDKVNDPSLGLPHLTYQIQDGKQVLFSPDPYTQGEFKLPSWL